MIAARNVVDGLRLREVHQRVIVRGEMATPEVRSLLTRGAAALAVLEDAVDAVSDAAVAESAHQAVQGNVVRTGTTLQAIASGEAPPPELDVARTPRSGLAVSHRVVVLLNALPAPAGPASPRGGRGAAAQRLGGATAGPAGKRPLRRRAPGRRRGAAGDPPAPPVRPRTGSA